MPAAARLGDSSTHGGSVVIVGPRTVMIEGKPAAVSTDLHICSLPPNGHQPTVSPFSPGSSTVFIGGMPALRISDTSGCGATPVVGAPTVIIA